MTVIYREGPIKLVVRLFFEIGITACMAVIAPTLIVNLTQSKNWKPGDLFMNLVLSALAIICVVGPFVMVWSWLTRNRVTEGPVEEVYSWEGQDNFIWRVTVAGKDFEVTPDLLRLLSVGMYVRITQGRTGAVRKVEAR